MAEDTKVRAYIYAHSAARGLKRALNSTLEAMRFSDTEEMRAFWKSQALDLEEAFEIAVRKIKENHGV